MTNGNINDHLLLCDEQSFTHSQLEYVANPEVFLPGEYTTLYNHPHQGTIVPQFVKWPIFQRAKRRTERKTTVPIHMVMHATHQVQARDIKRKTCYAFKPKPKFGKEGTYKKFSEDVFQKTEYGERVIEGNLSWWGVDAHSWYTSGDMQGRRLGKAVFSLRSKRVFVSPFMSNPRESPYGNYEFVVNFKDLLKYYRQSRTDVTNIRDRELFLRVGGTLTYRYEICYVVIVCTKYDNELECYPSLHTCYDVFDHKGLILPSGQIKRKLFESDETIDFRIRHVIKCFPKKQYCCYETPAFAFFYPQTSTTSTLKCPISKKVEIVPTGHKCNQLCVKKLQT